MQMSGYKFVHLNSMGEMHCVVFLKCNADMHLPTIHSVMECKASHISSDMHSCRVFQMEITKTVAYRKKKNLSQEKH